MENSSPNPSFSICDFRIQKQMSRSFGKSFPPQKIVLPKLRPHCSATCPNTWRAEHQRKMSFPLSRKISPPPNQECKEHFSLVLPREARQWRNDTSVRGSFKPPRAPRVRSGFAQRLIHHRKKKLPNPSDLEVSFCGEGGIRTHGDREATTLFESVPFVHSGTSPLRILAAAFSPSRAAAR